MYEPNVGDTVWVDMSFVDDASDYVVVATVTGHEIVDVHNQYVLYEVKDEYGSVFSVLSGAIYQRRTDWVREQLKRKMRDLNHLQREIARLERELDGENE